MNEQPIGLDALAPGQTGIILELRMPRAQRTRLEELGLLPGTRLQCLFRAPHGSPAAYTVGGAVFALRKEDAARLTVEAAP